MAAAGMFRAYALVFTFFLMGFAGWAAETINESVTRKKFVNKGFFRGPFVPVQAAGGMLVYAVCARFRAYPAAVFLLGMAVCTAAEYATALFLEKCFRVRCWDYRTYPHTRRCHFRGRVALTISLFFGIASLAVVYVLWDACRALAFRLGALLPFADGVFAGAFLFDAVTRCAEVLGAARRGVKLTGFALASLDEP